jgi:hypothetical protein
MQDVDRSFASASQNNEVQDATVSRVCAAVLAFVSGLNEEVKAAPHPPPLAHDHTEPPGKRQRPLLKTET